MGKHTPGPWETDRIAVRSSGRDGRQICLCDISVRGRNFDETYDEAEANARLIAAAPDMLEALVAVATCDLSDLPGDVVAAVRAAIAKAGATP